MPWWAISLLIKLALKILSSNAVKNASRELLLEFAKRNDFTWDDQLIEDLLREEKKR